jgi:hypothetical protein
MRRMSNLYLVDHDEAQFFAASLPPRLPPQPVLAAPSLPPLRASRRALPGFDLIR